MFDLKVWKIEAKKRLEGWANRWEAARQSGVQSLYAFLCSMALWPVVEAGQRGEFAALAALGHVAAGIGGNLIANMIQTWKDEAGGAQEIEKRVSCEPAIRDALDNILEKLDMLPQAGSELPDTEKAWFQKMLEGELRHLGNIARFRSVLIGPGAVAGAPGAKAASGGAVISDEIEDSVISTGPGSRNIKAVHYYEVRPGVDTSESKPAGLEASDDPPALECAYLDKLIRKVRDLPLPGIDPRAVTEEETSRPQLSAVYTALMTHRTEADPLCVAARRGPDMLPGERSESAPRKISALQVVNSEPRLVLLGDPGSGKSAFINFLTLCLAGERLGLQDANLRLLTEPIPEGTDERDESKRQPWDHDNLLPVRVVLRDFAVRGLPPGGKKADGGHLWDFIVSELGSLERSYAAYLKQQLTSGKALVMLDGLDEVPEAEKRRRQVKDAVSDFALTFRSCRILVTSRTYAYRRQDWMLADFEDAVLSPFSPGQIRSFVERWYDHVGAIRGMAPDYVRGRAALLKNALEHNKRLADLARRPLLLTLMASLHAWRGGDLPEKREQLYADAVALLLDHWERPKVEYDEAGKPVIKEASLTEGLKLERSTIHKILDELAFEAHRDQPETADTADIPQAQLVEKLVSRSDDPNLMPTRVIQYISQRTGLLIPRGEAVYTFPHRSFQEYLAARYLTDANFPDDIADLVRHDPDRWREVVLLAGAKSAGGAAANAWLLAEALCYEEPPTAVKPEDGIAALLAGQVLVENDALGQISERHRPKLERLRRWLHQIVLTGALSPVDRVETGNMLARVGDPRFNPDLWHLPVEAESPLGLVEIPAGTFWMGEGDEKHEIHLSRFFIGRYPTTVGQLRAFADASGYETAYSIGPSDIVNHPATRVAWHDAIAYCRWLTDVLGSCDATPKPVRDLIVDKGWCITLPSEAQWEKAARGGDGRRFPWGDEDADGNRANFEETGIGHTSAVGCFPAGASPYGILDMSGNVWEWTRSLWGKDWDKPHFRYPYEAGGGREDLGAGVDVLRVLRGGAYDVGSGALRCAYRNWDSPDVRYRDVGFRVVLSPV